jgi:hypothetical protein
MSDEAAQAYEFDGAQGQLTQLMSIASSFSGVLLICGIENVARAAFYGALAIYLGLVRHLAKGFFVRNLLGDYVNII